MMQKAQRSDGIGMISLMMMMNMMNMIIMKMMMLIMMMIGVIKRLHQDEDSWTALHAASANGHHRIAESVLKLLY